MMKCSSNTCSKDPVWRVLEVRNRAMLRGDEAFCEDHARLFWESYLSENREGSGQVYMLPGAACFELELVMADYKGEAAKALVREVGGKRLVVFPIGYLEVCVLYQAVQDSPYNEFTLHIALKRLVEHFGGTISHVIIDAFNPLGYFEANAAIIHNQQMVKLRIRPSDGLALAILGKVPFLVAEHVLSEKGTLRQAKPGKGG